MERLVCNYWHAIDCVGLALLGVVRSNLTS